MQLSIWEVYPVKLAFDGHFRAELYKKLTLHYNIYLIVYRKLKGLNCETGGLLHIGGTFSSVLNLDTEKLMKEFSTWLKVFWSYLSRMLYLLNKKKLNTQGLIFKRTILIDKKK